MPQKHLALSEMSQSESQLPGNQTSLENTIETQRAQIATLTRKYSELTKRHEAANKLIVRYEKLGSKLKSDLVDLNATTKRQLTLLQLENRRLDDKILVQEESLFECEIKFIKMGLLFAPGCDFTKAFKQAKKIGIEMQASMDSLRDNRHNRGRSGSWVSEIFDFMSDSVNDKTNTKTSTSPARRSTSGVRRTRKISTERPAKSTDSSVECLKSAEEVSRILKTVMVEPYKSSLPKSGRTDHKSHVASQSVFNTSTQIRIAQLIATMAARESRCRSPSCVCHQDDASVCPLTSAEERVKLVTGIICSQVEATETCYSDGSYILSSSDSSFSTDTLPSSNGSSSHFGSQ